MADFDEGYFVLEFEVVEKTSCFSIVPFEVFVFQSRLGLKKKTWRMAGKTMEMKN